MKEQRSICLLCKQFAIQRALQRKAFVPRSYSALAPTLRQRPRTPCAPQAFQFPYHTRRLASTAVQGNSNEDLEPSTRDVHTPEARAPAKQGADALQHAKELGSAIMGAPDRVPPEKEVLDAMKACERAARQLMSSDVSADDSDPASALLQLSRGKTALATPHHPTSLAISTDLLSNLAHQILLYPTVFMTPDILHSYVATQSILRRPESFPGVFRLYATKARPKPNTTPIKFTIPNPRTHTAAIAVETADLALTAAIRAKDMDLALDIINTTFRTLAWQRYKFLTRALLPLSGLSLVPFGVYILASQLAILPTAADPTMETYAIFGGAMTYVGVVASMGFIALTTANDQMKRVTWQDGTPLRERWTREEERAAMDRVVCGFGFQQTQKWGDESGPKWEDLREWIGSKGLVVDRVSLMEGME